MSDLGRLILQIRETLGITQAELGQKLGIRRNTISQYEAGLATPSAQVLMRLFAAAQFEDERQSVLAHLAGLAGGLSPKTIERITRSATAQGTGAPKVPATLLAERKAELKARGVRPYAPGAQRLLDETFSLIRQEKEIEPAILEIIRLYRLAGGDSKARRAAFRRAVEYLRVQLADVVRKDAAKQPG